MLPSELQKKNDVCVSIAIVHCATYNYLLPPQGLGITVFTYPRYYQYPKLSRGLICVSSLRFTPSKLACPASTGRQCRRIICPLSVKAHTHCTHARTKIATRRKIPNEPRQFFIVFFPRNFWRAIRKKAIFVSFTISYLPCVSV